MKLKNSVVKPELSILIISWNGWKDLQQCLESIYNSKFINYEIIIIDNGSTDGTIKNLEKDFPQIRLKINKCNTGHAKAVNQGLQLIQGESILLLDLDTEFGPNMIGTLMDFAKKNPDISVIAPRTYNSDGTVQESARNFPSFLSGLFGRQSFLTKIFPNNPFSRRYLLREKLYAEQPFRVEQVSSACMLFPKSIIEEIGLWDEGYFAYWVDTDWCMRLKKHNKVVYCVPSARLIHHESNKSGKRKSPLRIWLFHKGAYRLYSKHYTQGYLDPRAIIALIGLMIRTGYMLIINCFLPGQSHDDQKCP